MLRWSGQIYRKSGNENAPAKRSLEPRATSGVCMSLSIEHPHPLAEYTIQSKCFLWHLFFMPLSSFQLVIVFNFRTFWGTSINCRVRDTLVCLLILSFYTVIFMKLWRVFRFLLRVHFALTKRLDGLEIMFVSASGELASWTWELYWKYK